MTKMKPNFKEIHIGTFINLRVTECGIEISRICDFFKCLENEVIEMYNSKNLSVDVLLKWSKLLEYDFFRLYSQHLILFAPPSRRVPEKRKSQLPVFKKNLYTIEIIEFMLELIHSGEKTKAQIIEEYSIPKTTLYKWIKKYEPE